MLTVQHFNYYIRTLFADMHESNCTSEISHHHKKHCYTVCGEMYHTISINTQANKSNTACNKCSSHIFCINKPFLGLLKCCGIVTIFSYFQLSTFFNLKKKKEVLFKSLRIYTSCYSNANVMKSIIVVIITFNQSKN